MCRKSTAESLCFKLKSNILCYLARKVYGFQYDEHIEEQDLVFSVKLHFGLTLYPLSLPLVPFTKFRGGLFLSLSLLSLLSLLLFLLSQAKVKSTPSPRHMTGVCQQLLNYNRTRIQKIFNC